MNNGYDRGEAYDRSAAWIDEQTRRIDADYERCGREIEATHKRRMGEIHDEYVRNMRWLAAFVAAVLLLLTGLRASWAVRQAAEWNAVAPIGHWAHDNSFDEAVWRPKSEIGTWDVFVGVVPGWIDERGGAR